MITPVLLSIAFSFLPCNKNLSNKYWYRIKEQGYVYEPVICNSEFFRYAQFLYLCVELLSKNFEGDLKEM